MKILIDIGSATVKVYRIKSNKPELLFTKSISFKKDFDPDRGISQDAKQELLDLLIKVRKRYPRSSIKTYATAIFRKLNQKAKINFIDEIFQKSGIYFNIISHELENFYLEMAMTNQYKSNKELLLVNIGGGSTELVVLKEQILRERHNIDIGIGTVLSEFPGVNNDISSFSISEVKEFVKKRLPELTNKVDVAFYNGGELQYMQLVGYSLRANELFEDSDHPFVISLQDFRKKNAEVFSKITLGELESLMPLDPKWMHGARACSAIAQAIFEKYNVNTIIPSNSNLIDGVVRQKFKQVTNCLSPCKYQDI